LRARACPGCILVAVPLSYECLDADCGHIIVAADQAALVAAVQEHMSSVHESFELEDVIADTATEVAEERDDEAGARDG